MGNRGTMSRKRRNYGCYMRGIAVMVMLEAKIAAESRLPAFIT